MTATRRAAAATRTSRGSTAGNGHHAAYRAEYDTLHRQYKQVMNGSLPAAGPPGNVRDQLEVLFRLGMGSFLAFTATRYPTWFVAGKLGIPAFDLRRLSAHLGIIGEAGLCVRIPRTRDGATSRPASTLGFSMLAIEHLQQVLAHARDHEDADPVVSWIANREQREIRTAFRAAQREIRKRGLRSLTVEEMLAEMRA